MPRPYQTGSASGTSVNSHNREPHRAPQNRDDKDDGQRDAQDRRHVDDRYEVRGRFDKDYNRDPDGHRDTRSRNYQDDPWANAFPRRR